MAVQLGASSGDATAADVLTGVTFSNATEQDIKGTMPNLGTVTLQPGSATGPGYATTVTAAAPGSGSTAYTTAGTYTFTVPSGVTRVFAVLVGGGAGGAAAAQSGSSGILVVSLFPTTPGESLAITVGAGGAGGTSTTSAANGTTSSLSGTQGTLTAGGGLVYPSAPTPPTPNTSWTLPVILLSGYAPSLGNTTAISIVPSEWAGNGSEFPLVAGTAWLPVITGGSNGTAGSSGGGGGGNTAGNGGAGGSGVVRLLW